MKGFNKLIVFGLMFGMIWSCKKDEIITNINPNAALVATLSAPTLVLLKDNETKDAFTITWATPDYGFDAAPSYSISMVKKGGDLTKATPIGVGADLKKVFKTSELNKAVIAAGIAEGNSGDIDIQVTALLGARTVLKSAILSLKATTYIDKLDLSTPWGLVGSATLNGWNGPDQPIYKSGTNNELVVYATLTAGAIKFRQDNAWVVNLGGAAGVLSAGGADINVTAGIYKITMNPVALTYKIEVLSWGIVGTATLNGWNGPDQLMRYDATVDLWRAEVKLTAGAIKIRSNNAWVTSFGGAAGVLSATGGDIAIAAAGTYLITVDFKKLLYTITPYDSWGLVGDATPTGWNGPDTKFTYDLSTKKWTLNNIVLIAGAVKFRTNDAWATNLGATGTVEPLPLVSGTTSVGALGGKNLGVVAGTWSFELDLADPANPKYKGTKK